MKNVENLINLTQKIKYYQRQIINKLFKSLIQKNIINTKSF
jgi:hypothetical protein